MTKIGILDDEVLICETLTKFLLELGYEVPEYATNYNEAVDLLHRVAPDIFLLDVNIKDSRSGVDVGEYIRLHSDIPIIFVSSYSDKETIDEVRKVKPNGYLIKPFTKDDLFTAIEVAISNYSFTSKKSSSEVKQMKDAMFVKQDSLYHKLVFKDILYIKSEGVYLEIFTESKKLLIRETMKNMLDALPINEFDQVHRSYIIRLDKVSAVSNDFVVIQNEKIPVSKFNKEDMMERIGG